MAAGRECGMSFAAMEEILREFRGAQRRLECIGEAGGVKFYDDYAHHPTEIERTLEAAGLIGARRKVVLFQPHRYTRTKLLAGRFGQAFADADEIVLLPVYSAGEDPIAGADVSLIADEIARNRGKEPQTAADFEEACDFAERMLAPGDMVLTLGAGNIKKAGEMLFDRFVKKEQEKKG
jgi:UDP-N-acetylmuramate--alanine ligase